MRLLAVFYGRFQPAIPVFHFTFCTTRPRRKTRHGLAGACQLPWLHGFMADSRQRTFLEIGKSRRNDGFWIEYKLFPILTNIPVPSTSQHPINVGRCSSANHPMIPRKQRRATHGMEENRWPRCSGDLYRCASRSPVLARCAPGRTMMARRMGRRHGHDRGSAEAPTEAPPTRAAGTAGRDATARTARPKSRHLTNCRRPLARGQAGEPETILTPLPLDQWGTRQANAPLTIALLPRAVLEPGSTAGVGTRKRTSST